MSNNNRSKKAQTARKIREAEAAKEALSFAEEELSAGTEETAPEYPEFTGEEPETAVAAEAAGETEEAGGALEVTEIVVTQHSADNGGTIEIELAKTAAEEKPETASETAAPEKAREAEKEVPLKKAEEKPKKAKSAKKPKKPAEKPLKPVFAMANIIYTSIFFVGITLALLLFPRSDTSYIEQRKLATFPEFSWNDFINGKFTDGITEFYDDTVPYRDDLKRAAAAVKKLYGVELGGAQIYGQLAVVTEDDEEIPPPVQTTPAQTTATEKTKDPEKTTAKTTGGETTPESTAAKTTKATATTEKHVNEIADGVITNGQVVAKINGHYYGISLFSGGAGTTYAAALNRFRGELDDSIRIYSMIAPTAGEFYLPSNYEAYNASHAKSIDKINAQLIDGITPIDAIAALGAHRDEPIYTRTDHHWQPLGAYYAAQAFAEEAEVPFLELDDCDKVVINGYVGTMYSYTQNVDLLNDPEEFVYYKPRVGYKTYYYNTAYVFDYQYPLFVEGMPISSSYSTFMGGDKKIVRIETEEKNGRKLLIFKDSYGNAEVPFYVSSFEEIYICDMRYFDLNAIEFINEHGITDLLFTMCTFSAVGPNANGLENILNNPVSARADGTLLPPAQEE